MTKLYSTRRFGYDSREFDFEPELEALCEISPEAIVVHDLELDKDGNYVGTMVIQFGPDKVDKEEITDMARVVNEMIDLDKGCDCRCVCDECEGAKYDVANDDVVKLGEELKQAVDEFGKLIEALSKDK